MEFLEPAEVKRLLKDQGISEAPAPGALVFLHIPEGGELTRFHLAGPDSGVEPHEGAKVVALDRAELSGTVEAVLQGLRLNEVILFPVSVWRDVFDAVAFSLAENEDWQAFDATATVELNTRDPLLCEAVDFQLLTALVTSLLTDAESAEQTLLLTSVSVPMTIEVVPNQAVRISVGNRVIADEVAETLGCA